MKPKPKHATGFTWANERYTFLFSSNRNTPIRLQPDHIMEWLCIPYSYEMSRESTMCCWLWFDHGIVFGPMRIRRRWQKRESTVEILRFIEASWVFSYTFQNICIYNSVPTPVIYNYNNMTILEVKISNLCWEVGTRQRFDTERKSDCYQQPPAHQGGHGPSGSSK